MPVLDTTKKLIENFYTTRLGGTFDTLALLLVGGALLQTAPLFAPRAGVLTTALPAALGTAYLSVRFLKPFITKFLLPSNIDIPSDHSPFSIDPTEWDGLLFGYTTDTGEPVAVSDGELARHILIVGMTGVGKTVIGMLLMFQQIMRGGGMLFVDGKLDADNLRMLWYYCQLAGRPQDLRIINPGDPANSQTYNPILDGDPDEVSSRVLSTIPSTANSAGADHYRQEANQGLSTIVAALQKANLAYNMIDVSILLLSPAALMELENILAHSETGKDSDELKNYRLFLDKFKMADQRTGAATINMNRMRETFGGIGGRLYMFGTGKFGQVMNTYDPDIRMYDSIMSRHVIYAPLPTMGKSEAANNFGKLLIGDLRTATSWIQALPKNARPNPPFLCFLDEVGSYATEALARLFDQGRSANLIMVAAMQNYANLQAVSDEFAEMVVSNTFTKVYFTMGSRETAEAAAEHIGKRIGVLRSISDTTSSSQSASFLRATPESSNATASGMSTGEREQEEYIVDPEELQRLAKGEVIVTYGGGNVYSLSVPYIEIPSDKARDLGDVMLTRSLPRQTKPGANFGLNPGRFLQV